MGGSGSLVLLLLVLLLLVLRLLVLLLLVLLLLVLLLLVLAVWLLQFPHVDDVNARDKAGDWFPGLKAHPIFLFVRWMRWIVRGARQALRVVTENIQPTAFQDIAWYFLKSNAAFF